MEGRAVPGDAGVAAFVIAGDQQRLSSLQDDLSDSEVRDILVARCALGRDRGRLKIRGWDTPAPVEQCRQQHEAETQASHPALLQFVSGNHYRRTKTRRP